MSDSQKHSWMRLLLVLLFCFACGAGFYYWSSWSTKLTVIWLYPPILSDGNDFNEGRAWMREQPNGPWTLLDDKGNILKKDFKAFTIQPYEGGVTRFHVESGLEWLTGFLDRSGDVVSSPQVYGIGGGYYNKGLISKRGENGGLGLVDLNGNWVISPDYMELWLFQDDLVAVKNRVWKWGFIDLGGQWVISPDYTSISAFQEGLAIAQKEEGGKWGFIDKNGAVAIDFKYDYLFPFLHNMAIVQEGSRYGVIDPQGRWIAEPVYEFVASNYWSDLIAMVKDGKVGFIDSKGKVAIDFQFLPQATSADNWYDLYHFDDGYASVILEDLGDGRKEYGVIDESGRVFFKTNETPKQVWNGVFFDRDEEGTPLLIDINSTRYSFPPDFRYPPVSITPTKDGVFTYRDEKSKKMGYFTIDKWVFRTPRARKAPP